MSNKYTPLTEEDIEAIELMTESSYMDRLSQWEHEFMESIAEQDRLSPKQRAMFEKICERVLR